MAANDPLIIDTDNRQDAASLQPKTTYAGDAWQGQPYISVTQDDILISGSKTSGIAISDKFGVTIGGKLSLATAPDQIQIGGGYWTFNPLILSCLPSTTPTPIPMLVKSTPRLLQAKSDAEGAVSGIISNSDAAQ